MHYPPLNPTSNPTWCTRGDGRQASERLLLHTAASRVAHAAPTPYSTHMQPHNPWALTSLYSHLPFTLGPVDQIPYYANPRLRSPVQIAISRPDSNLPRRSRARSDDHSKPNQAHSSKEKIYLARDGTSLEGGDCDLPVPKPTSVQTARWDADKM